MKNKRLTPKARALMSISAPLLSTLIPLFTRAAVNMKDASYSHTWVDTIVSTDGAEFRVQRRYDSRSLFDGIFGFGWCSDLDTSLTQVSPGLLSLRECGTETEVLFYSSQRDAREFHAPNLPSSFITERGTHFIRRFHNGLEQRFDRKGKILAWTDEHGQDAQVDYDKKENPVRITVSTRKKRQPFILALQLDPQTRKLDAIRGQGSNELRYTRSGVDLTRVEWPSGATISYRYDDVHNLVLIEFPDRTREAMTYDRDRDWIMSVRDRKGCMETFEYTPDESGSPDHFVSRALLKCGTKIKSRNRFEFWHERRSDGRRYLARAIIERASDQNGQLTDIKFDPDLGHSLAIKRRNQ